MTNDSEAVKQTLEAIQKQKDDANWGWYYSRDEEYFYGPFNTKGEAILEGQEYDGSFEVVEAHVGVLNTAVFSSIDEMIDDYNYSEEEYVTEQISQDQWRELETELNAVAIRWAKKHNFKNPSFDKIRHRSIHSSVK